MKFVRREANLRFRQSSLAAFFMALLFSASVHAQGKAAKAAPANPFSGNQSAIAEGQEIYNRSCTDCHGRDGAAGDRAPALAAPARRYLRISDRELFDAIENGIPGTLMPRSGLAETEAWKVTAYIRGVRGTAIDAPSKGDVAHGEQIFSGKGGCNACHMVHGKGGLIGPDLSNVASQRKLGSIRDALTKEEHRVATDGGHHDPSLLPSSQYRPIRVITRDGQTVSGIVRNEDNYSLQVLGSDNTLHLFSREQLREVVYGAKSLMPSDYDRRLTPDEMQDLLAYLSRLGSVAPAARGPSRTPDDN